MKSSLCLCCPLSPFDARTVSGADDSYAQPSDAPVLIDSGSVAAAAAVVDDDVVEIDGSEAIAARGIPAPNEPSAAEVARHNLTHHPYRSWCPHCLASRRPNSHHRRAHPRSARSVPLFCADYCFVQDAQDEDLVTILAGKLYPSMAVFATVVDAKGNDEHAISRLTNFIRESGIANWSTSQIKNVLSRLFLPPPPANQSLT